MNMVCILKKSLFVSFFLISGLIASEQEKKVQKKEVIQVKEVQEIVIPKVEEKDGDLYEQLGITKNKKRDEEFLELLERVDADNVSLKFSDIPLISDIPLPKKIKEFFNNIVMSLPDVKILSEGGFSVEGKVTVYEQEVWARVLFGEDKLGKNFYSVALQLPKSWKFSSVFPKIKNFDPKVLDLLEYKDIWYVLSSAKYKDDTFKKEIKEGLNFFGSVAPAGPLFEKLDVLFGGQLKKIESLDTHGVIALNPTLIGTMISIDLPVGVRFAKWLKTNPLKLIFYVEEEITQTPTIAIFLEGGLKILFPLQKEPVEFTLTGKYSFPEDFEFFAKMNGWIKNVPVKGLHWGNLNIGFVTDLALIVETAGFFGWIAGLKAAGSVGIEDSELSFFTKGAFSGDTGIGDLTFVVEGTSRLRDLVGFWLQHAQDVAVLFKKPKFKDQLLKKIPNFDLEDVRIAFVPRETIEEKKRIEVGVGSVNIFGLKASGSLYMAREGVRGAFQLPEIIIGPKKNPWFFLTGVGEGQRKGMVVDMTLTTDSQVLYGDAVWGSSLFGGIVRKGRTDISPTGFEIQSAFKWGGIIDTDLSIKASLLNGKIGPENFSANILVKQEAQDNFAKLLYNTANEILDDIYNDLDVIKDKLIKGLKKGITKEERKTLQRIIYLENKIKRKKETCDEAFSKGVTKTLRPACYVVKGIPIDYVSLLHMRFRRDVTLKVVMDQGKAVLILASQMSKVINRSMGSVVKFLARLVKNTINIRHIEAEAGFKQLLDKKPFILKNFDATMFGHNIKLKDVAFDLNNMKAFVLELFDKHNKGEFKKAFPLLRK